MQTDSNQLNTALEHQAVENLPIIKNPEHCVNEIGNDYYTDEQAEMQMDDGGDEIENDTLRSTPDLQTVDPLSNQENTKRTEFQKDICEPMILDTSVTQSRIHENNDNRNIEKEPETLSLPPNPSVKLKSGARHTHTFKCDICGQEKGTKNKIRSHILEAHMKTKFPCDKCQKAFPTNCYLSRHKFAVHSKGNKLGKIS